MKVAIVRGKHLNNYEMQSFEPLVKDFAITAFGSLHPFQDVFAFPTIKLPSPMDLPEFPYKMPVLNRVFIDAQYLFGLENRLKGFDIVHTAETYYHYTQQALYARKKGYVKKVIATVLENIPFNNEGIWGRKGFKKRAREELDHIIALTERTKESLLLEGADERKITVIGHGIDTTVFRPAKDHFEKISDKKLKNIKILFSGRLEEYKGVFEIVFAAKMLLLDKELSSYNLEFVFVGDGSEKEKLLAIENQLGIKKFITHKHVPYNKMPDEYRSALIAVTPGKPAKYYVEQYCTALLEAQSSGLPTIATYCGGMPENLGDAGILVQPADVLSLTQAIKSFILNTNKRIVYAKKARQRAEKVHDIRIISKKIANIYREVMQK